MAVHHSAFNSYTPTDEAAVTLADSTTVEAPGVGTATVAAATGVELSLSAVLHVPCMTNNLFSVRAVTKQGGSVLFDGNRCEVRFGAALVATGRINSTDQYVLDVSKGAVAAVAYGVPAGDSARLWHRRFFHLGADNLRRVSGLVNGMGKLGTADVSAKTGLLCRPCVEGRMQATLFPASTTTTSTLELLHIDLVGPLPPSLGKAAHFVSILDDATDLSVGTPLQRKADAASAVEAWILQLERQTGKKVKRIRCDGAGELGDATQDFYRSRSIRLEPTAAYSPQQNGKAEHLNRTLMERVRAVMAESGMGHSLWAEAMLTAVFTRNRSPSKDGRATPFERIYNKKPDVSMLRVWGSPVFALKPKKQQRKLEAKVLLGRLVGYGAGGKAYRVYTPQTKNVVVRRDVVVDEGETRAERVKGPLAPGVCMPIPNTEEDTPVVKGEGMAAPKAETPIVTPPDDTPVLSESSAAGAPPSSGDAGRTANEGEQSTSGGGRHPTRSRNPKVIFEGGDAQASLATASAFTDESLQQASKTYEEAKSRPDAHLWEDPMRQEVRALLENEAWVTMELPEGQQLTNSRWVFDLKRNAAGKVTRYKARFVVCGYSQRAGIDCEKVWALTPAKGTVRAVLATVAARNWELHVMDVKTAYLNAAMDKNLFVKQPKEFESGGPRVVCHVLRAMYGSKQAGNLWAAHLFGTLAAAGAKRSTGDPCPYIWQHPVHEAILFLVHADDAAMAARTPAGITTAKEVLTSAHMVRDMGEIVDFLGMRVVRDRAAGTLTVSNPGHTAALLATFGMSAAHATKTPMAPGTIMCREAASLLPADNRYSELVGALLYLATTTRPDISCAVGVLSRFMHNPEESHWRAAKYVLRYLAGTAELGLCYGAGGALVGACDADYAGDVSTRRSTSGWCFTGNGAAVSWASKLQPTVSVSTAEAEYLAAAAATKEALWLQKLLADLGEAADPIRLAEDNQACLAMLGNSEGTGRAKHIDVAHHFVRDRVGRGEVEFFYTPSGEMVADGLAKPLPAPAFVVFRLRLGVGETAKAAGS